MNVRQVAVRLAIELGTVVAIAALSYILEKVRARKDATSVQDADFVVSV